MHMATIIFALAFTLSLVVAQPEVSSSGLTRDFCRFSRDCKSPRRCFLLNNATLLPPDTPCPAFDACRCVPPSYTQCQASSDCADAEICARTVRFPFVCTSSTHVDILESQIVTVEDSLSNPLVPSCAPPSTPVDQQSVRKNGLVLDPCLPGTCANGLSCVLPKDEGDFDCCGEGKCLCHAPDTRPKCETATDCNKGEVCGVGPTLPQQCYSVRWMRENQPALLRSLKKLTATPTPAPSSSDKTPSITALPTDEFTDTPEPSGDVDADESEEEEAVCVDAEALKHVSKDQLVFETHRLARVLCDANGSCATAGHIVKFEGSPMMMKNYCQAAECVERVLRVNSVRYKRGVVIPSKTDGLEYTAFAARYATHAEEAALSIAVRVGL